jgi:hypothetical protein
MSACASENRCKVAARRNLRTRQVGKTVSSCSTDMVGSPSRPVPGFSSHKTHQEWPLSATVIVEPACSIIPMDQAAIGDDGLVSPVGTQKLLITAVIERSRNRWCFRRFTSSFGHGRYCMTDLERRLD